MRRLVGKMWRSIKSWDLTQPIITTNAVFVYEGIEYIYAGGVSHETMKEFLETLQ